MAPPNSEYPDEDDNANLMPIVGPIKTNLVPASPVPPTADLSPADPLKTVPKPGTVLGTAIKSDDNNNPPPPTADEPDETKEPVEENTGVKKKTFITKEYGLKK